MAEGELSMEVGLVGDTWKDRPSKATLDGSANPQAQITLMNSRAAALIAQSEERWALAGDQLYVDMDLSETNLPPGAGLALGASLCLADTEEGETPLLATAPFVTGQMLAVDGGRSVFL